MRDEEGSIIQKLVTGLKNDMLIIRENNVREVLNTRFKKSK